MAKTGMLIRKSIVDVFEAFINPDITLMHRPQNDAYLRLGSGSILVGLGRRWLGICAHSIKSPSPKR